MLKFIATLILLLLLLIFGCTDSHIEKERLSELISKKDSLISYYQEQINILSAENTYLSLSCDTVAVLSYRVGYREGRLDVLDGIYFAEDKRAKEFENRFIKNLIKQINQ